MVLGAEVMVAGFYLELEFLELMVLQTQVELVVVVVQAVVLLLHLVKMVAQE